MRTKGDQQVIRQIIAAHGLVIEDQRTVGNFTSYKLRRSTPAYRIVPCGGNYYFNGVENMGKRKGFVYTFINTRINYTIRKRMPNTTILGNMAWYDLITAILETGARVDVLGQKFESVQQYHDFCNYDLYELVEAERQVNGGTL